MPREAERIECTAEQLEALNKFGQQQNQRSALSQGKDGPWVCAGARIKTYRGLGVQPNTVIKWRERFNANGMDGLYDTLAGEA